MYRAKVYQIMTGAPGDIGEEVNIVRDYIAQWNGIHSYKQGVVLLSRYWGEDCHPEAGERAQSVINRQLTDRSDMLICILNARLGEPTGAARSGTVEEIEEHLRRKKPVLTYFKKTADLDRLNPEQFKQVLEFKDNLRKHTVYRDYKDSADFERLFYRDLEKAVNTYFIPDRKDDPTETDPEEGLFFPGRAGLPKAKAIDYGGSEGNAVHFTVFDRPSTWSGSKAGRSGKPAAGDGSSEKRSKVAGRPVRAPKTSFAPPTRLRVTFPDGFVIVERYARDTLVETIRRVGIARVADLGINCGGVPLVGTERIPGKRQVPVEGGYYIMVHSSTEAKKRFLERVSKALNQHLQIEVIPWE